MSQPPILANKSVSPVSYFFPLFSMMFIATALVARPFLKLPKVPCGPPMPRNTAPTRLLAQCVLHGSVSQYTSFD